MDHVALFAFLIYFSLAVAAAAFLVRAWITVRSGYIKSYLVYSLMFSGCNSIWMLSFYISVNTELFRTWGTFGGFEYAIIVSSVGMLLIALYYLHKTVFTLINYENTLLKLSHIVVSYLFYILFLIFIFIVNTRYDHSLIDSAFFLLSAYFALMYFGVLVFLRLKAKDFLSGRRLIVVNRFATFHMLILVAFVIAKLSNDIGILGNYSYLTLYLLIASSINAAPLIYLYRFLAQYESKTIFEEFTTGIDTTLLKELSITSREAEIIQQIASGKTNREIGDELCIAYQTVKDHVYNIYKKMNVNNRVQLINALQRRVQTIKAGQKQISRDHMSGD